MLILLPIFFCLLTINLIYKYFQNQVEFSFRRTFIFSLIIVAFFIWLQITFLSIINSINKSAIIITWIASIFILLIFTSLRDFKKVFKFQSNQFKNPIYIAAAFIVFTTLFLAIYSPPNVNDSLEYHLPKIEHWIQNNNTDNYPTPILTQLYLAPFAEYLILNVKILTSTDRFDNIVQWIAFISSALVVSLIAKNIGISKYGQIISFFLAITLPMAILESTSTQNDLVAAFFILCTVMFLLEITDKESINKITYYLIGIVAALSIFTKGTSYLILPSFFLILVGYSFKFSAKNALTGILIIMLLIFTINSPLYVKNLNLSENILGFDSNQNMFQNQTIDISTYFSNIIRNIALHIQIPSYHLNENISQFISNALLYINIDPHNPANTFGNTEFKIPFLSFSEGTTGNFWHFILILSTFIIVSIRLAYNNSVIKNIPAKQWLLFISIFLSFSTFCLFLKWQPWNSRFHIIYFFLFIPFILLFHKHSKNRRRIYSFILIVSFLQAIPFLIFNRSRQIIPLNNEYINEIFKKDINLLDPIENEKFSRYKKTLLNTSYNDLYFINYPEALKLNYNKFKSYIKEKKPEKIGVLTNKRYPEYLVWEIIDEVSPETELYYLSVNNESLKFQVIKNEDCDLIIRIDDDELIDYY